MKQINQLEREIGVELLERTHRGVKPTAAGTSLYRDAAGIILLWNEALSRARTAGKKDRYTVRVGYSLLNPAKSLIELWSVAGASHPEIALQMVPFLDDPKTLPEVYDGIGTAYDFIVGPYDLERHKGLRGLELGRASFCICVPRRDDLASFTSITPNELQGRTLLLSRRGSNSEVDKIREDLSNNVDVTFFDLSANYGPDVFNLCESTGNPLLSLDIWDGLHPSLVTIPVSWHYSLPIGVMHAPVPSPAARVMLDALAKASSTTSR